MIQQKTVILLNYFLSLEHRMPHCTPDTFQIEMDQHIGMFFLAVACHINAFTPPLFNNILYLMFFMFILFGYLLSGALGDAFTQNTHAVLPCNFNLGFCSVLILH